MSIVIVHALGLFTPGWVHHYAFPDLGCSVDFNPDPGINSQVPFQSMETIGRNSEVGGVRGDTRVFLPGGSSLGGHAPGLQLPQDRPVWIQALSLPILSLLASGRSLLPILANLLLVSPSPFGFSDFPSPVWCSQFLMLN